MFTYVVHGLLYCHVLCLLLYPARACGLAFLLDLEDASIDAILFNALSDKRIAYFCVIVASSYCLV